MNRHKEMASMQSEKISQLNESNPKHMTPNNPVSSYLHIPSTSHTIAKTVQASPFISNTYCHTSQNTHPIPQNVLHSTSRNIPQNISHSTLQNISHSTLQNEPPLTPQNIPYSIP